MRVRTRRRVESRKGQRMRDGYSPSEHATNQLHVWTRASFYLIASTVAMADKGDDGGPKEAGKQPDQPENLKEGETAALMRQLLAAIERQQGKPGDSSKGKPWLYYQASSPPGRV